MSENVTPGQSVTFHCACGFFTTLEDYLADHFYETDCNPSGAQREWILSKLRDHDRGMRAARESLQLHEGRAAKLHRLLVEPNKKPKPTTRYCCICKKATKEFFGEVPLCRKHIASARDKEIAGKAFSGAPIAGILEDFLYGS
jgi:hypothetical protein